MNVRRISIINSFISFTYFLFKKEEGKREKGNKREREKRKGREKKNKDH